jgi:MoaA/NifB/PqqE/SkfB family radical SAM enzyme
MDAMEIGGRLLTGRASGPLLDFGTSVLYKDMLRRLVVRLLDGYLMAQLQPNDQVPVSWRTIARQRHLLALAVLHTVDRVVQRRFLSPQVARVIADLWGRTLLLSREKHLAVQRFHEEYGCDPPWFITISPGHACNLRCPGCYANSGLKSAQAAAKLDWSILDRIMTEAKELWSVGLFVFSGGEPLLYRSEGKDLLDIVEKHSDSLFLMFTNGTLIDKETAARLARLGNLTPALSVEGLRGRTDERRGRGIFDRLLEAIAHLRGAGVPFGISATVTRSNCEEILSDEFLDFFFVEQGAFYGFLFQYLPIGQSLSMEAMLTHEQRLNSWRRTWEVIESKRVFLFDFWNHGPLVDGCLSGGREGGYIYIDWNGKVMPCVFAPYSVANIRDIYAQGGTLNDVWKAPFFEAIRRWQGDYGYGREELTAEGNWLSPCPVRDHYGLFREWIERYEPEPEDEAAEQALLDGQYYEEMAAYGVEYRELSQKIWEEEYLGQEKS